MRPKGIITDIEGTTTSISFVYDVLFPYARERLVEFLSRHETRPDVAEQIQQAASMASVAATAEAVGKAMLDWMDADKKIGPLKVVQGMIWQAGYENGQIKGHVYADVPKRLQQWQTQGLALYVYSSGSVQAQKLIFGYSQAGDLRPYFSDYFDTAVGNKREVTSYAAIADATDYAPSELLFLSDITEELDAAAAAGLATIQLVRDEPIADTAHQQVADFSQIVLPD